MSIKRVWFVVALGVVGTLVSALLFLKEVIARGRAFNCLHAASVSYRADIGEGKDESTALLDVQTRLGKCSDRLMYLTRDGDLTVSCNESVLFVLRRESWWTRGGLVTHGGAVQLAVGCSLDDMLRSLLGTNRTFCLLSLPEAARLRQQ